MRLHPAEGTVRFGLDGTDYEIDLNTQHAQQLREALTAYVKAGRRVSGAPASPPAADAEDRRTGWTLPRSASGAKAQGIEVKDRGRVPLNWS